MKRARPAKTATLAQLREHIPALQRLGHLSSHLDTIENKVGEVNLYVRDWSVDMKEQQAWLAENVRAMQSIQARHTQILLDISGILSTMVAKPPAKRKGWRLWGRNK